MQVVQHVVTDERTGCIERVDTQHKVMLTRVTGDTPALKKLGAFVSHNAKLGCHCRKLRGVWEDGAVRFKGYCSEVDCGFFGWPEGAEAVQAKCGDDAIKLSHDDLMDRAYAVICDEATAAQVGCHGFSQFLKCPTFHYADLLCVGSAHVCLYGLVRAF